MFGIKLFFSVKERSKLVVDKVIVYEVISQQELLVVTFVDYLTFRERVQYENLKSPKYV
jgi:hypothetical protein